MLKLLVGWLILDAMLNNNYRELIAAINGLEDENPYILGRPFCFTVIGLFQIFV